MAVRYYLGPLIPLGRRGANIVIGSPLMPVFRKQDGERVTVLKLNHGVRMALHRYDAPRHRLALADSHPLLIPLPTDKDGRWTPGALAAFDKAGVPRARAMTSTREIAQIILANQAKRPYTDAGRSPIVMAHEVL